MILAILLTGGRGLIPATVMMTERPNQLEMLLCVGLTVLCSMPGHMCIHFSRYGSVKKSRMNPFFFIYILIFMWMKVCLHKYRCTIHIPFAQRCQKSTLDPLELEL